MDNYKANCINAVADGSVIICPQCNASNQSNNKFCATCGTALTAQSIENANTPAFTSVSEDAPSANAPAFASVEEGPVSAPAFASVEEAPVSAPAFAAVNETAAAESVPAFKSAEADVKQAENNDAVNSESAFANGLPSWSIEPPQVMVRRR